VVWVTITLLIGCSLAFLAQLYVVWVFRGVPLSQYAPNCIDFKVKGILQRFLCFFTVIAAGVMHYYSNVPQQKCIQQKGELSYYGLRLCTETTSGICPSVSQEIVSCLDIKHEADFQIWCYSF
jgi:hypothetical protein